MSKQKRSPSIPTLNTSNLKKDSTFSPNSEEDRIILTPTPKPAFSNYIYLNKNQNLNLEYIKNLDEKELKFYFVHNTEYNQCIFCKAVEQNEIKIVITILEANPELINIKALPEKYNILHIALLGVADETMIEILLKNKPKLIAEKDKEELTPLTFGEKYGFGKALSEKSIEKVRKKLVEYEKNTIINDFNFEDELLFSNNMKLIDCSHLMDKHF